METRLDPPPPSLYTIEDCPTFVRELVPTIADSSQLEGLARQNMLGNCWFRLVTVAVGKGIGINLGSVDIIARYRILSITTKRTRAGEVVLIDF